MDGSLETERVSLAQRAARCSMQDRQVPFMLIIIGWTIHGANMDAWREGGSNRAVTLLGDPS